MSIFDSFERMNVQDLPPHSPIAMQEAAAAKTVTILVDVLKKPQFTPNKRINDLAALGWDLIGNNITPCAIAERPNVAFMAEVINPANPKSQKAVIFVPTDFKKRCDEDAIYYIGAMVFAMSQARDFWNNRIVRVENSQIIDGRKDCNERAKFFESEFLWMVKNITEQEPRFNDYQKELMEKYKGWDTPGADSLWYESEPFQHGKIEPYVVGPKFREN